MRLVTCRAIGLEHRLGVRRMAIDALGDIAVSVGVTEVAGHLGMHAGAGGHLLARAGMAAYANRLEFACKLDIERLVRIVTAHAVRNFVVAGAGVAAAAFGDVVRDLWTVAFMAGLTVDFRFMRRAVRFDLRRLLVMTLDTIIRRQFRLGQTIYDTPCQKHSSQQKCYRQYTQNTLHYFLLPHSDKLLNLAKHPNSDNRPDEIRKRQTFLTFVPQSVNIEM